tara:strand:+ start:26343 stop:27176 length:834 start_codon:yes stop_codon:yes gene_type:complete
VFIYIDSAEDLRYLNNELLSKKYVGIDTEFRRTQKDNMKLGLLQINDSEEIYLIDTVLINEPKDNCSFLFSDSVIKILHSCKEDIEAVYSWAGRSMENIFDTQIADSFLNGEFSISYQGLVEKILGIKVDKGETRSNWLRRPLRDSQLNYAASDVEFLIELFKDQSKALIEENKDAWMDQEIKSLSSRIFNDSYDYQDNASGLTKAEERILLNKFNDIVIYLAEKNEINQTFLFSKKNQKYFLRLAINVGLDNALLEITQWRSDLFGEPLTKILKTI